MDTTQAYKFLSCPESYRLNYGPVKEGLQLRKTDQQDTRLEMPWGGAVHAGLEAYYLKQGSQEINLAIEQAYQIPIPAEEKLYTLANAQRLLVQYPNWAEFNDSAMEVLGTEIYGEVKLGEGYAPYQVIIDTVIGKNSGIWSLEHKTTGKSLNAQFWGRFDPSMQVSAQAAYIEQEFGQCSGVIVNAISVSYLDKPKLLEVGNPEAAEYEIQETKYSKYYKQEMVYCSGFNWRAARQIFNRTPEQIEDFKRNARRVYDRLGETVERYGWQQVWEKNESQCYFCPYKDLCRSCGNEQIREVLYEQYDAYGYIARRKAEADA